MTTLTKRLLALAAVSASLAPAAGVAIASGAAPAATRAQCNQLKQRLEAQAQSGTKPQLDASTRAQLAACDRAYGGDKGGPPLNPGGPRPPKTQRPASGSKAE